MSAIVDGMTYFPDLSEYVYSVGSGRPGGRNVGWLNPTKRFSTGTPDPKDLDSLWSYYSVSVTPTRGVHKCQFCSPPATVIEERSGLRLLLGTAEIRVFAKDGTMYAAPTLIYHYVSAHDYMPPLQFITAVRQGPKPPDPEYFYLLERARVQWSGPPPSQ